MDGEATAASRPGRGTWVGQAAARSHLVTARDGELLAQVCGDPAALPLAAAPVPAAVPAGVVAALLDAVLSQEVPGPGSRVLGLDLRFSAAVRPGDVVTGSVEVVAAEAAPGGGGDPVVRLDVRVVRDDGAVAATGTALCGAAPTGPAG